MSANEQEVEEELNPLEDAFRDKIKEYEDKLDSLDELSELVQDLDDIGAASVDVSNYSMSGEDVTHINVTGWVPSLAATAPDTGMSLAERVVMLNPDEATVGYDDKKERFRVGNTIRL